MSAPESSWVVETLWRPFGVTLQPIPRRRRVLSSLKVEDSADGVAADTPVEKWQSGSGRTCIAVVDPGDGEKRSRRLTPPRFPSVRLQSLGHLSVFRINRLRAVEHLIIAHAGRR